MMSIDSGMGTMITSLPPIPNNTYFPSHLTGEIYTLDEQGNLIGKTFRDLKSITAADEEERIRQILCTSLPYHLVINKIYREDNIWWHFDGKLFHLFHEGNTEIRSYDYTMGNRIYCYFEEPCFVTITPGDMKHIVKFLQRE